MLANAFKNTSCEFISNVDFSYVRFGNAITYRQSIVSCSAPFLFLVEVEG